ncbi:MAG: hypothetical protein AAB495_03805 [Patescibacteria group bacterium]
MRVLGLPDFWEKKPVFIHGMNGKSGEKVRLEPGSKDDSALRQDNGRKMVTLHGSGTRETPFGLPARDCSPYYGVFYLWHLLRLIAGDGDDLFVEANDCVFGVTSEGVIASDGVFTKLLPEEG